MTAAAAGRALAGDPAEVITAVVRDGALDVAASSLGALPRGVFVGSVASAPALAQGQARLVRKGAPPGGAACCGQECPAADATRGGDGGVGPCGCGAGGLGKHGAAQHGAAAASAGQLPQHLQRGGAAAGAGGAVAAGRRAGTGQRRHRT